MNEICDSINICDIECYTSIGVGDREREIGQRLVFDVEVKLDLVPAGKSDDLSDTVSYVAVVLCLQQVCSARPYRLLEHLAATVCEALFAQFCSIEAISLTVHKPHIPDPVFRGAASVSIHRRRVDMP